MADCREELLSEECSDWLLREDGREGEELRDDCSEGLLSDECREVELKEWLLSDDWMFGLLSDDCKEGLLSVLCRDDRSPETETHGHKQRSNRLESHTDMASRLASSAVIT